MSIEFFPDITPSRSAFKVDPNTKVVYNPYNRVETIIADAGDKWLVQLQWAFLTRSQIRDIRVFLLTLKGQSGVCYLKDTAHRNEGIWTGTPKVNGANQYGNILNVDGFPASTKVALAGDRFSVSHRMHELIADATTHASGQVQLKFEPEIINSPADNDPLIHATPYSKFFLKSAKEIPTFSQNKLGIKNVKLNFVEAIR